MKYFIKIIIEESIFNSSYEKEFAVVNPYDESILYKNDFPIRLKVGVKNLLSLSIEFEHSNYNCRGTLKGFLTFNLVNTDIKFMEIQLIRREILFDGKKYEPEYISRFELVDGGPCKHERLPIRFFLKSYNLTPSYPDIEEIFGVKYFLNFVVVDGEDNRYFKFAEINLLRLFSDRRTHTNNYDNNGLFISEPFFENEFIYSSNTFNDNRNKMNINNYYENDYDDEDNNYINRNNYYDENINLKDDRFDNSDNNLVLNIPGDNYSNQDYENYNIKNRNNNDNNNIKIKNNKNRFNYNRNDKYKEYNFDNIQNNNYRSNRKQNKNNYFNNNNDIFNDNKNNLNFNNYDDYGHNLE